MINTIQQTTKKSTNHASEWFVDPVDVLAIISEGGVDRPTCKEKDQTETFPCIRNTASFDDPFSYGKVQS